MCRKCRSMFVRIPGVGYTQRVHKNIEIQVHRFFPNPLLKIDMTRKVVTCVKATPGCVLSGIK